MNMREKIARGINPSAFDENWQGLYFFKAWQDEARAKAFSQADAALYALMDPTDGMLDSGCFVGPDTNEGSFSYNDADSVFTAMIRAAKEGK